MSIPALIQTYDEVRRLAVAGSVVAPGDFRLKKLVPVLEQAGRKAPVFAKVAEAVTKLVESTERTSAEALLELATLVSSILYTQGETGLEGELAPLPTVQLGRPRTQASARLLKPIQEALTSTGSGRFEIIRDGYEREAFHDLRLVAPTLAALDDSYPEIADLVADKILPLYGPAIFPELEAKYDPLGKAGQVRRLLLMHRLDPEAARPHVLRSLEEGSSEVRAAAIGCLGDSPEDLPFLLEQAKSRAKGVRAAALKALGHCDADEAAQVLCDTIPRADLALAVEALRESRHSAVTGALLDEAEKQRDILLTGKARDAKTLGQQNERMSLLLDGLRGREDARTEQLLLSLFEQAGRLSAIKGAPSGSDVVERLVPIMASASLRARDALIEAHETLPAECLGQAFAAARRSRDPAEVFVLFHPYLTASVHEKKKSRGTAGAKQEAIVEQLLQGRWWMEFEAEEPSVPDDLDPRWLDLAVRIGRADLVHALAEPGHAGACEFLDSLFQKELGRPGIDPELYTILTTMTRVGHSGATDAVIKLLKKLTSRKSPFGYYGLSYWVGRLIPRLPRAEALPKLEALLPSLPESMIGQLVDSVNELKQAKADEDLRLTKG